MILVVYRVDGQTRYATYRSYSSVQVTLALAGIILPSTGDPKQETSSDGKRNNYIIGILRRTVPGLIFLSHRHFGPF